MTQNLRVKNETVLNFGQLNELSAYTNNEELNFLFIRLVDKKKKTLTVLFNIFAFEFCEALKISVLFIIFMEFK